MIKSGLTLRSRSSDPSTDWQHGGVTHQPHIRILIKRRVISLSRVHWLRRSADVKHERVRYLQAWMKVEDKIRSTTFSTCKITTTNDPPLDLGCPRECELFWTFVSPDRNWLTAITSVYSFRIAVLPGDGIGTDHRG